MERPNVVFIVLDTARADRVSALGYTRKTTPNFDAFAGRATLYTDAVAQAPWSVPSHATLFTGRYPQEHGTTTIRPIFDASNPLPRLLSAAGYGTYAISSNEYVSPANGFARGFDEFRTLSRFSVPDWVSSVARPLVHRVTSSPIRRPFEQLFSLVRLRSGKAVPSTVRPDDGLPAAFEETLSRAEQPYFLFVNLLDCHLPRSPAPEHAARFVEDELRDVPVVTNERAQAAGDRTFTDRERRAMSQFYDADLRTMDDRLETLLSRLAEHDDGETLIVLASDHGEHLGEFDLLGHQYSVFDPVVSVPLAISYPGRGSGKVDKQVELRRVFHTILDEAGVDSFPEQSLAAGTGDKIARGSYRSPMVDIEEHTWNGELVYDSDLLGEPLSFLRHEGRKLVRFDDEEWLFELPEHECSTVDRDADRETRGWPGQAVGESGD